MGHLGIFAQTGVLQLDKAACPDAAAKLTAAAHAGIGADDGVLPHAGVAHLRGVHHGARADDGIVDDAPRADDGLLADDSLSAQHRAGQQARAGSDAHGRLDIAAGCVIDLHARAGEGQQAVALQQARDLRQLGRGGDGIHGLLLVHGGAVVQQEAGKGEVLVERLHQLLAGDAVDAREAPCGLRGELRQIDGRAGDDGDGVLRVLCGGKEYMQQVRGIAVHRGHDLRFGGQARAGRLDIAVVTDQKEAPDTAVEQSVRQPREQRRAHDALQHQGLRISGFCRIVRNKDHCGHSNHGIRLLSHGNTAPLYQIFPHSSICFPPESKQIPAAGRLLFCRNPITAFLNRPGHGFLHRLWKTPKFLPLCGQSPRISGGETACTAQNPCV